MRGPLSRGEFVDRSRSIPAALSRNCRCESRLVGRIWEVLGFQSKTVAKLIRLAPFTCFDVEIISGVELHTRFGSPDFHRSSGCRLENFRGQSRHSHFAVQHEVMIVTLAQFELLVLIVNSLADGG